MSEALLDSSDPKRQISLVLVDLRFALDMTEQVIAKLAQRYLRGSDFQLGFRLRRCLSCGRNLAVPGSLERPRLLHIGDGRGPISTE